MSSKPLPISVRLFVIIAVTSSLLALAMLIGLSFGSSSDIVPQKIIETLAVLLDGNADSSVAATIILKIRLPRVILAAVVGAVLALGGLVFQALLRNPLAEPYILGVSGGSAIGAILGILLGFTPFPGVTVTSFAGSLMVLFVILVLAGSTSRRPVSHDDSLLLGGVMMNAFCAAVIMFLISVSRSNQLQSILFWLMGDFASFTVDQLPILFALLPSFIIIVSLGRAMNLLLLGSESAASLGIDVRKVSFLLLIATSLMVSIVVSQSGLVGFVGLVIPHILRNIIGADHRLLIPACLLGGGAYMIFCDLLARIISATGELPVGVITALIGAPVFIFLLWREKK
jgi:iron complex transport system permease protein